MSTGFEFLFTILANLVIELPLLFIISKFIMKWGHETDHVIFSGTIGCAMRLSYIWFVLPLFLVSSIPYYIYILQAIGILIETLVLYNALRVEFNKILIVSVVINVASFLVAPKVMLFITSGKF
ncbi:MAG: hypothetical protein WCX30_03340 [Candidatus Paceibacterota bacterium]|jgi:hypothetical protein|nr:hypothetical protein [bacterium]